jgi:hypothetical protein
VHKFVVVDSVQHGLYVEGEFNISTHLCEAQGLEDWNVHNLVSLFPYLVIFVVTLDTIMRT